eukprot:TRINITY_DN1861_c0_g1_i1.p1 TRINITY_DN1861_c0_g1~~TRINITY_DN1861_c0_g1_i1.p1  ORF type:complete len:131 (+),score=19.52 TRINITY_DN1861_c0_g1_i1:46-393(+)
MNVSFGHGEVYFTSELQNPSLLGKSVKTFGIITEYNAQSEEILLKHREEKLRVDISLISSIVNCVPGAAFQFIGELKADSEGQVLHARVGRNIDGMDLSLYEEAIVLKRKFENSL